MDDGEELDREKMMRSFNYLNQSGCYEVPTEDDVTNWHMIKVAAKSFAQGNLVTILEGEHEGKSGELEYPHLKLKDEVKYRVAIDGTTSGSMSYQGKQMELAGISIDDLMQVLAGILHLGEINFVPIEEKGMEATVVEDPTPAKRAARFLGIGEEGADWEKIGGKESVFTRVKMFGTFQYETAVQAGSQRDSMSKAIFEKMFHWLMETVNKSLRTADSKMQEAVTIGILDIFGFEMGIHNSFEQLCINYCNEKLQQQFIHFIFTKEAEFYEAEGIPFKKTEFKDNSEMLDLIEKQKGGLFRTLDDQSMSKSGSDQKFFEKFAQANRLPPNDQFLILPKPLRRGGKEWQRMSETERNGYENSFQLMHYASVVTYDSRGFVQKNGDKMSQNLLPMLRDSNNKFIASLFKEAPERDSLGKKFKTQLHTLMGELELVEKHFIRCVKPNETKSKTEFDAKMVYEQLSYTGLIHAVNVRKQGFPERKAHDDFFRRYQILLEGPSKVQMHQYRRNHEEDHRGSCELLIQLLVDQTQYLDANGNVKTTDETAATERPVSPGGTPDGSSVMMGLKLGSTLVFYRHAQRKVLEAMFRDALEALIRRFTAIGRGWCVRRECRRKERGRCILKQVVAACASAEDQASPPSASMYLNVRGAYSLLDRAINAAHEPYSYANCLGEGAERTWTVRRLPSKHPCYVDRQTCFTHRDLGKLPSWGFDDDENWSSFFNLYQHPNPSYKNGIVVTAGAVKLLPSATALEKLEGMLEKNVKRSLAMKLAVEEAKKPPIELLGQANSYKNHLMCAKIQTMLRASLGRVRYVAMNDVRVEVLAAMKALTDLTHFQNTKVDQVERALARAEKQGMDGCSTFERVMTHGGVLEHPTDTTGNLPIEIINVLKRLLLELKKEQVKVEMKRLMAKDPIQVWPEMQQLVQRMEETAIDVHILGKKGGVETRRLVDIVDPKQLATFQQRIEDAREFVAATQGLRDAIEQGSIAELEKALATLEKLASSMQGDLKKNAFDKNTGMMAMKHSLSRLIAEGEQQLHFLREEQRMVEELKEAIEAMEVLSFATMISGDGVGTEEAEAAIRMSIFAGPAGKGGGKEEAKRRKEEKLKLKALKLSGAPLPPSKESRRENGKTQLREKIYKFSHNNPSSTAARTLQQAAQVHSISVQFRYAPCRE
jgi:hypothetical protein